MEARGRRIGVALLLLSVIAGVGLAVTGGVTVDGTITLDDPDGPEVQFVTSDSELLLDGDHGPSGELSIHSEHGTIVVTGDDGAAARVHQDDLEGATTTVTEIEPDGGDVVLDPGDKPAVTVADGIDEISFASMTVDDSETDFTYSASSTASVTVNEIGASDETVIAVAADGTVLDQTTADSSGSATFSALDSGDYEVQLATTADPELSNGEPSAGETVTETPVELSIDVEDADFDTDQGDEVEVTFYDGDDSEIGTDTVLENGTASTHYDDPIAGENEWYAVAEDSYGNEVTSDTFEFATPSIIELRDESDPEELVETEADVEVTFFAGRDVFERTTDDGTVSLEGLPADESFTVQADAEGYINRQVVIESITDQQEIYLLPEDGDNVEVGFTLNDPSGQFTPANTRVSVLKPIRQNDTTEFRTVAADDFGEAGYSTLLERDQRYIVEVTDTETGEQQDMGPFVATSSREIELQVDDFTFDFTGEDAGYRWGAQYQNDSAGASIDFDMEINQSVLAAESLEVTITDGATGDVIYSDTTIEPETVSKTATIPTDIEDPETRQWQVEWVMTTVEGEEFRGSTVVGASQLPLDLPGVSEDVLNVVSVLIILMVAGMFSAANVTVGGIVTSLVAGGLWFAGALPDAVTGILIALALFVSVLTHLRTNQQVRPT